MADQIKRCEIDFRIFKGTSSESGVKVKFDVRVENDTKEEFYGKCTEEFMKFVEMYKKKELDVTPTGLAKENPDQIETLLDMIDYFSVQELENVKVLETTTVKE